MEINVDLDAMINPHFDYVLYSDALNKVLEGGRGSTKSSVISLQLVLDFLADDQGNALIMRKVANTIGLSVYEQIKWAIYELHVERQFIFRTSPYRITHKRTGTAFYFSGVDDPQKLKSIIIAKGYVRWLWFEELAEFESWAEIDMVRASFTRKKLPPGKHVETFYSYNPPKNPYEWINDWAEKRRTMKGWYVDHSTYLNDELGLLSDDYLDEIEVIKQNDYDYYRWMYLGEVIGLGTNIYNAKLLHPLPAFPDDDYIKNLYFSQDTGQQVSATTELCIALTAKGRVVLLDTYYYSPVNQSVKKPPSELATALYEFEERCQKQWGKRAWKMSADEATSDYAIDHEYFRMYNRHWHHVHKTEKTAMIDHVQDLLATGRFFYLSNEANKIFVSQHQKYQWDGKTVKTDKPKVIKVDDHTCDAFMYFVLDNLRDLDLIW
ncbi:PBSX family phage terminase large subunit [Lactiplantibacillus mudanjiangensis]|uniref:Phage terminase, large subunit [Lactobacillus acidipiscis] n=1 Tax=Lactiplantibacillus mudanjiangensis TaxID=1296538 RepID=A0A660E0E1_9LACO|nr:PBSX family phage terminase large subunit [Lactiplantibacillus mudanjiangensis]VDG26356.1 Phage terminase, large subunit [Lactobacillus acidipiscis] [Lactiplantibacillus mudanjiangensis]VDG27881.1 Phage terminase, large subunit [Lactobacillus acidipiscis] [Lactiplantibacillus mudanjiangensis]